jgi:2,4-dienoyl-CoA reductase-like NADH-dependent reductase (Old Yellow Enzyme family)
MQGSARDGRTLSREAYFLEFAKDIAAIARMPVMVTGGIRRIEIVQTVLDNGVAMAGIGTALAIRPDLPAVWQQGADPRPELPPIHWKNKVLASLASMAVVKYQLARLSRHRAPVPKVSPIKALLISQFKTARLIKKYRRWMVSSAS